MIHLYAASCTKDGGIYHYIPHGDGKLEFREKYPLDSPAYCSAEGGSLYVLLREPFRCQSGVARFLIEGDGSLRREGGIVSTRGAIAAHVLAHRGRVYAANYISGTTILLPDKMAVHGGSGPDPERQDASHPHCVVPAPDGGHVCVADLGADAVYVFDLDLRKVSETRLPPGTGPRHLVFSPDGRFAYCSGELNSTASVFLYSDGALRYLRSYSTLPQGWLGHSTAAAIRMDREGKTLLVSNRGHDSVCVFSVSGGELAQTGFISSLGRSPREFNLAGDLLLIANELSDNIVTYFFSGGSGSPAVYTGHAAGIPRPWCITAVNPEEASYDL